jgi:hypothetical protein
VQSTQKLHNYLVLEKESHKRIILRSEGTASPLRNKVLTGTQVKMEQLQGVRFVSVILEPQNVLFHS